MLSVVKLFSVGQDDSATLADQPVFSHDLHGCLFWYLQEKLFFDQFKDWKGFCFSLYVMQNGIFGWLLVNICSRWSYLYQFAFNGFVFFDLLQTLGLGDVAFIWLTSLTFNTRTWPRWILTNFDALISWRWAAAVISQLLLHWLRCQPIENYNNKGNRFSCSTIVNIIYSYTSVFICKITFSVKDLFSLILIHASPVRRQFKQYLVDIFVVSYEKIQWSHVELVTFFSLIYILSPSKCGQKVYIVVLY